MLNKFKIAVLLLLLTPATVFAANIAPSSYDMPNGNSGAYHYWDDTYTGTGSNNIDGAFLSGGLGDLTNGIIANSNWYNTEQSQHGPFVGWTTNPTITFHFVAPSQFTKVNIYLDDSNGSGGVSAPGAVKINGVNYTVADPVGTDPFLASFDVTGMAPTDRVDIQIIRNNSWVFASEVQFEGPAHATPEPATMLLLGSGLAGLIGARRKKKAKA